MWEHRPHGKPPPPRRLAKPPAQQVNNKQEGSKGAGYWLRHMGGGMGVSSKFNS
jgi:hypothetical protein